MLNYRGKFNSKFSIQHSALIISCLLIISGCSSDNRFASSFGKRKYTKGYFWNTAGRAGAVASNAAKVLALPIVKPQESPAVASISKPGTTFETPRPVGGKQYIILPKTVQKSTHSNTILILEKQLLANMGVPETPIDSIDPGKQKLKTTGEILMGIGGAMVLIGEIVRNAAIGYFVPFGLLVIVLGFVTFAVAIAKTKPRPQIANNNDYYVRPPQEQPQAESMTETVSPERKKTASIITIAGLISVLAAIVLNLKGIAAPSFLVVSLGGLGAVMVFAGLVALELLSMSYRKSIAPEQPQAVTTNQTPVNTKEDAEIKLRATNDASVGFFLSLSGFLLGVLILIGISSGFFSGLGLFFLLIMLFGGLLSAVLLCILGLGYCIAALSLHVENKKGLAIAGLIIDILAALISFGLYLFP